MYEIELCPDGNLCEIYQQVSMRFALGKIEGDKVTQLHPFVMCRDFIGDALWATHFKKLYQIYGFKFDGTAKSVQLDKTCVLVEYDDDKIKDIVRVLHHFEAAAKWKRSKLIETEIKSKNKKVWLVIGSACWMRSPTLISLYTLLWRLAGIGINEDEDVDSFLTRCENSNTNDGRYLKTIRQISDELKLVKHPFYTLTRRSYKIFKDAYKFGADASTSEMHNYHGPVGVMNKAKACSQGKLNTDKFINDWANKFLAAAATKES